MPDIPFQNIIRVRKNQEVSYILDVDVEGFERLKRYQVVECHVVLYPYSRQVASQDLAFYPFEEYVRDVLSQQRSAYTAIRSPFSQLFGLFLGLVIALVFARFNPQDLFSIESIVSVFGAYTIGKELWDDIEGALIKLSKGWPVRVQDNYYRYRLEKHTTLTSYSYLAKQRRYGRSALLPEKVDFIKQSNSQTLRMCFNTRDLVTDPGPVAHLHSIHVEPVLMPEFEQEGFLLGVKLSLNRRFLGITKNLELFQSIDGCSRGCLNDKDEWIENGVFYRRTFTLGRLKYYGSKGVIPERTIVNCEVGAAAGAVSKAEIWSRDEHR
jgi:hypothetical protein